MTDRYILHYWPSIPGRGEYIRLAFEASGHPFEDDTDIKTLPTLSMSTDSPVGHPAHFAPPILEVRFGSEGGDAKRRKGDESQDVASAKGDEGERVFISQTPAILAYLAPKLGLLGNLDDLSESQREVRQAHVNQLTLTALDLSNETHDVHHPIDVAQYYEDQKDEAKRRAASFRNQRVPKFLRQFNLTIEANPGGGGKHRLVGDKTTIADLVLFQVIDGLKFAYPRLMKSIDEGGEYAAVLSLYREVGQELEGYVKSERRRAYSNGIFRDYPELDGELEKGA